jgi:predicted ATPase/class 3 adenylate cyclase
MDTTLPSGTITFLFTDIESSTEHFAQQPAAMQAALERHHAILQAAIDAQGGYVFQIVGDAFCAAFHTARQGLDAALEAQRALLAERWVGVEGLSVRMGLHTGAAELHPEQVKAGQYSGHETLARTQRIMSVGHGGQILLTSATVGLLGALPPGVSLRDLGARHLKGLPGAERIFQVVAQGLPADFPPLRIPQHLPNNLPAQLTSFIGREAELRHVNELLEGHRLVTLTGAGGCGKTRLALQVASSRLTEYPDGAWLVDLAPIADPELVAQAACSALGLRLEGSSSAETVLISYLQEKYLLLLLDNCEHLVEGSARLAEAVLRACPDVAILASSREVLEVDGEAVYRVQPLSLPASTGLEALRESEAGRLFVARAALVLPGYTATAANAAAIEQVCRRLDGIPLAIELAAARIDVLRVEQIAARLADVFTLLAGGRRSGIPHHQTLRATIDWSYRLLDDPERLLLGRLAVFAGGWTLEAAEAVCAGSLGGAEQLPAGEILDLLSHLTGKSLVVVERNPGQEARCFLYETIRLYTLETQSGRGESTALRQRHLQFFLQLAEQAETGLNGWESAAWLRRLESEHPNLRLALEWSLVTDPQAGLRICVALAEFWDARGYYAEGAGWLDRLLEAAAGTPPDGLQIRARMEFVSLGGRQVLLQERVLAVLEETIPLARRLGEAAILARALHYKSLLMVFQGASDQDVVALEEESLMLARLVGDALQIGQELGPLAERAKQSGDYQRAAAIFSESLHLFEQVGHRREIAGALWNLAEVGLAADDLPTARQQASASLAIYQELGDRHGVATTLRTLGKAATGQGDYSQAKAQLEESIALFKELGDYECGLESQLAYGWERLAEGDFPGALAAGQTCQSAYEKMGYREGIEQAEALIEQAKITGIR